MATTINYILLFIVILSKQLQEVRKKCAKIFVSKTHKTLANQVFTPQNTPKIILLEKVRKTDKYKKMSINSTLWRYGISNPIAKNQSTLL